ncbi:aldehyde dehydrogenase family protein [Nocardioides marmorisolisilvae]|uniref:Aldehyde dehydrogenase family protein n=1 Tax=Nocardioides marmorisolisilvae TaxID=1542737 RepID=A0A3N0DZP3_9ACTN|nr:aldehyde dehydrogenase family protein [Nocardioides marmorisolisilvae]RNL81095.1 aldehyde dehydrogenase family protein [Nocardioides marmorisolisilvae]
MTQTADTPVVQVNAPADGGIAGTVPALDAAAVAARAAELRANQAAWQDLGADGRAPFFAAYRDWLLDNGEEITDLLQLETGKVRHEALIEIGMATDLINYFSKIAGSALATEKRKPHNLTSASSNLSVQYTPHQLVGVITPWNFPIAGPFMDVTPALCAGAAVLIKPSEVTPLSIVRALDGWKEIGAPDVFGAVTGTGETGAALVDVVDFVQFTGSTATGRKIAQQAAGRLIGYSLELGGKDPMIVLADADIDRAVNGAAWGGLFNSGQVCVSVERVYVEAPVYDEFVTKLSAKVAELRQGPGPLGSTDVGSMATPAQVDIVQRHVDDAVANGARVLNGGHRGSEGYSFEPTVLVDVDHSMSCMREETFGPTIPVMKVANADEAIRLANDTEYGLSASVWTTDEERGLEIAGRLDAGAVNVNNVLANLSATALPHGGWKESGIGSRFGGEAAIRKYCRAKAITTAKMTPKNELNWYPYTKRRSKALHRMVRLISARGKRKFARVR